MIPAGMPLQPLLRSAKWSTKNVREYLYRRKTSYVENPSNREELLIWDTSQVGNNYGILTGGLKPLILKCSAANTANFEGFKSYIACLSLEYELWMGEKS